MPNIISGRCEGVPADTLNSVWHLVHCLHLLTPHEAMALYAILEQAHTDLLEQEAKAGTRGQHENIIGVYNALQGLAEQLAQGDEEAAKHA